MERISVSKILRIAILWAGSLVNANFIIDLEEDEKECFHIRVSAKGSILSGNFACWEESEENDRMRPCRRGGRFSAWVDEDPPSEPKRTHPTVWDFREEYEFRIDVPNNTQRYRLCFLALSKAKHDLQQASSSARKDAEQEEDEVGFVDGEYKTTVGFNIHVHDVLRTLAKEEMGPDALRAIHLQASAMHVADQWENLNDHFSYMHFREAEHRRMSEQINDRVMGWTILESFLVVTMAIGQVVYWKSFFEQRRFL